MRIHFKFNKRSTVVPWTASRGNHHACGATKTEALVGLLCATIFGYVP